MFCRVEPVCSEHVFLHERIRNSEGFCIDDNFSFDVFRFGWIGRYRAADAIRRSAYGFQRSVEFEDDIVDSFRILEVEGDLIGEGLGGE